MSSAGVKNDDFEDGSPSAKRAKSSRGEGEGTVFPAKIVQFKKPAGDKQDEKVVHGIMEVLEGEFKGLKGFFQGSSSFVWGYSLGRSNLMYYLRPGDVFQVEAYRKTMTAVYGNMNDTQEIPLVINKCWLGTKSDIPQTSTENVEFSSWLSDRDLSEFEFKKWINDRLPHKPFFPLQSETYEGTLVQLIREHPKCDGGIVKITSQGTLNGSLVLFEREDLYVCGVSAGAADLRMIARPGDTLHVQVQFMTSRERQSKGKKYPKIEEYEINHSALLAYLGNKRPRGPDQQPKDSLELRAFLDKLGLRLDEFEAMRVESDEASNSNSVAHSSSQPQGGVGNIQLQTVTSPTNGCFLPSLLQLPPFTGAAIQAFCPAMPLPSAIPPMGVAELEQLSKCAVIISRALVVNMMRENNGTDINVGEIIETDEDVENAIRMGRWLTEALIAKMQTKLQDKVKNRLGPNFGSILSTQKKQIEAAVTAIASTVVPAGAGRSMPQGFQAGDMSEQSLLEQQRMAQRLLEADKGPKGDLVHEVRASREESRRGGARERRPRTPELNPQEVEEERRMSPVELVRKYVMLKRRIRSGKDDTVVFGDIRYPKNMKVNFRISNNYELTGGPKEFYTMECIYYFSRNIEIDHSLYVRRALTDNLPVVRKPDRDSLISYLTGKVDFVSNIERMSISDLNPGMVMPEFKPSRPREERSRDGGDRGGDRGRDGGAADRIRHDIDLKTGLPTDPISQAISIVSAKMSAIDPEAGEKWRVDDNVNPGMSALEQWKAKNNFVEQQQEMSRNRDREENSRKRSRSGEMGRPNQFQDQRIRGLMDNRNTSMDIRNTNNMDNRNINSLDNRVNPFENVRPEPRFPGNEPFPPNNDNFRNFGGNNGNMNPGLNMNPGMMMNQGMVPAPTMNMNPVLGNQGPNMGNQGNNMGGLGPMFNQPSNSMW